MCVSATAVTPGGFAIVSPGRFVRVRTRRIGMPGYDFELILSRPLYEPELDPLFQRTRGNVTVGFVRDAEQADHTGQAGCSWHAASLAAAVMEVIGHIEASAPGLRVLRVEADPLLTLREIAERAGRTAESVRLSIKGTLGPGGFPAPETTTGPRTARQTAPHRRWRWSQVAAWYGIDGPQLHEAGPTARAINGWLELREVVPQVAPEPRAIVAALASALRATA
jgi:hypothetical protein